jgi:hypothetical protein
MDTHHIHTHTHICIYIYIYIHTYTHNTHTYTVCLSVTHTYTHNYIHTLINSPTNQPTQYHIQPYSQHQHQLAWYVCYCLTTDLISLSNRQTESGRINAKQTQHCSGGLLAVRRVECGIEPALLLQCVVQRSLPSIHVVRIRFSKLLP